MTDIGIIPFFLISQHGMHKFVGHLLHVKVLCPKLWHDLDEIPTPLASQVAENYASVLTNKSFYLHPFCS
jgi:hypothetical protein